MQTTTPATSEREYVLPALGRAYAATGEIAEAGLRVAAGLFLVPHGAQKLFGLFGGYGLEATGQFFETQLGFANGFLAALAAGSVETFGGLLLALGLLTRPAAAAIAALLLLAMTVHVPNGFFWTDGGWEYPVLWAAVAALFVVKGGGRYSLDRLVGREL
jgi:putative oxidoreductase